MIIRRATIASDLYQLGKPNTIHRTWLMTILQMVMSHVICHHHMWPFKIGKIVWLCQPWGQKMTHIQTPLVPPGSTHSVFFVPENIGFEWIQHMRLIGCFTSLKRRQLGSSSLENSWFLEDFNLSRFTFLAIDCHRRSLSDPFCREIHWMIFQTTQPTSCLSSVHLLELGAVTSCIWPPQVTTDPSARIAAKADSVAWACWTPFRSWTWELSPPKTGAPQVTTDPSDRIAANVSKIAQAVGPTDLTTQKST